MTDKLNLWVGAGCFAASGISFWLWKDYIVTGPAVRVLIWLFVALFGLGQIASFVFSSQFIFRATRGWIERILFFVALLGCEAYVSLMAALGMNFVGQ